MTFLDLKSQTSVLLTSDVRLPRDDNVVISSLKIAFIEISDMSSPLRWLTLSPYGRIMRNGPGDYFVRAPDMPTNDTSELDIDDELVPAVAFMMASYIAKEIRTKQYYYSKASEIMKRYDAKVRAYINSQEHENAYEGIGTGATSADGTLITYVNI